MSNAIPSLFALAVGRSEPHSEGDIYTAASKAFCDGIGVSAGIVTQATANKKRGELFNCIHSKAKEITIRHLTVTKLDGSTILWFTLDPNKAMVTCETFKQILKIVEAVRLHAALYWNCTE